MLRGVHHIALRAVDFEKSYAYYTQVLGMKEIAAWGEGDGRACMLDCGGSCIELFAGGKTIAQGGAWFHLALRTDDPDAMYKKSLDAGLKTQMEPKDVAIPSEPVLNVRIAFVVGYDGEVLEFFKEL